MIETGIYPDIIYYKKFMRKVYCYSYYTDKKVGYELNVLTHFLLVVSGGVRFFPVLAYIRCFSIMLNFSL